jgi:hypothetical protein
MTTQQQPQQLQPQVSPEIQQKLQPALATLNLRHTDMINQTNMIVQGLLTEISKLETENQQLKTNIAELQVTMKPKQPQE